MTPDPDQNASLAPRISAALDRLQEGLATAAGSNFVGLVLYGGVARGRYRPGKSDVNVVLILEEVSREALAAVGPALRAAWKEVRVEPFILARAEIPRAADVFPTRFLDIQQCHVLLAGDNPFAVLLVPLENVRLRVEQEFRNLQLRLRQRYVAAGDDPPALGAALARAAQSLAIGMSTLLWLAGRAAPEAASAPAATFAAAAEAFELDAGLLNRLAAMQEGATGLRALQELYAGTLAVVDRLAAVADDMAPEDPVVE